ncbi:MAG: bifunctional 4-hydroxy-2-oxoglutarate aldolase/2-dehydro-3-deoxy-phosphogluconate aldolase [Bacteroidota bacterium]
MEHQELLLKMGETGLIPVFNHTDVATASQVLEACYEGGVRVFEFTNRGDNALEVFAELAKKAKSYPDLSLGIGTIFSAKDAKAFLAVGADFIISPAFVPEVADFCNTQSVLWIPGCGTVTEIYHALQLGAKIIKAFPGNMLGPGFVKSVKAVYPEIPIMPTGGVKPTEDNLSAWFNAGVHCVGMGSQLFQKQTISEAKFKELTQTVSETLTLIQNIRA